MGDRFAKVVINTTTRVLDKPFTYLIPDELVDAASIGSKALVPFGNGNKYYEGFIIGITNEPDGELNKIKAIKRIIQDDIHLSKKQLELCSWLRQTYLCSYYEGIKTIVPSGSSYKSKVYYEYDREGIKKRYKIDMSKYPDRLDTTEATRLSEEAGVLLNTLKKNKLIKQVEEFYTSVKLQKKDIVNINQDITESEILDLVGKNAKKQRAIIELLLSNKSIEYSVLRKELGVSKAHLKPLINKEVIYITSEDRYRSPIVIGEDGTDDTMELTEGQQDVYFPIRQSIDSQSHDRFLLHGITGSGKTNIYMQLVEDVLRQGRQAIILVPEISLTTQLLNRFVKRFGNKVAVLHSKLSVGERYDQWVRIKRGELPIVIGARSAVFAPCENIGLIVLDEEHEATYKSETNPKYHTKNVARFIAKQHNGVLLLGSATPDVESYYHASRNNIKLLELNQRYNKKPLPNVEVVDMRIELEEGNKSILSKRLYSEIKEALKNGHQTILFLNRRGYSNYLSCRSCGFVLKCDRCDISLTYHQKSNYAKCHYCGKSVAVPKQCPSCDSEHIRGLGIGTEKVEHYISKVFPEARVARLDQDTTSQKNYMDRIINEFEDGEYDILIGTQMVAKGLDFPKVALVGVLLADTTLNLPDYKANERTFQLLTQVAGRAGRHEVNGRVIVQTYEPDNYSILASSYHNYNSFYNEEIQIRRSFEYPPFYNISNITVLGKNEEDVIKSCYNVYNLLNEIIFNVKGINKVEIMGPNPSLVTKVNNFYRWQILVKYPMEYYQDIKKVINYVCKAKVSSLLHRNTSLIFDIKPFKI